MACRGVHFALLPEDLEILLSVPGSERPKHIANVIEEKYFRNYPEFMAESDKAWDAIHRVLSDGKLSLKGGTLPLSHVILGGEILYSGSDYIISLKHVIQVQNISKALLQLDEASFRERYFTDRPDSVEFQRNEPDFQYTWEWFQEVRQLYFKASAERRVVIFTVDQ